MKFSETRLPGGFVLEVERRGDDRGYFARVWCQQELVAHKLDATAVQANVGFSQRRGTLRGMHFQRPRTQKQNSSAAREGPYSM